MVARVFADNFEEAYWKFKVSDEEGEVTDITDEPPYHSIYNATID